MKDIIVKSSIKDEITQFFIFRVTFVWTHSDSGIIKLKMQFENNLRGYDVITYYELLYRYLRDHTESIFDGLKYFSYRFVMH